MFENGAILHSNLRLNVSGREIIESIQFYIGVRASHDILYKTGPLRGEDRAKRQFALTTPLNYEKRRLWE